MNEILPSPGEGPPIDLEPTDLGQIMVNKMFDHAVAPLDKLTNQKGKVGQGTQGAAGAGCRCHR